MTDVKLQIPPKLEPFVSKHKRFKIAYGGRGGAKSQSFADMLLMCSQVYSEKIGCFREYQTSIDDSVHALLKAEITRLDLEGFSVLNNKIDNQDGGGFRFKGLARSATGIKSMHGFKKFWVEEAQDMSEESLRILTPTLREEDSECWMSLNPQSSADPISQRFIEPFRAIVERDGYYEDDLHYIVKINYHDNPWFPDSLEQERQFDKENMSSAMYDHVWLGEYNDTIEGAIIMPEWFDSAIDAHLALGFKPQGKKILSHDPSDEGADDKALAIRHGSVLLDVDLLTTGDSADGIDWAVERALDERCDLFNWDCDGLGVSLKRQVKEQLNGKQIDYTMFKGSEGVDRPDELYNEPGRKKDSERERTNKEIFRNKRAQYAWALRDRFFNTHRAITKGEYIDPDKMISISSDIKLIHKLKSEVCRIPKKHNGNGYIQIMSKPEMKKLKIKSPNLFDSCMMSMCVTKDKPKPKHRRSHVTAGGWQSL